MKEARVPVLPALSELGRRDAAAGTLIPDAAGSTVQTLRVLAG